jgi:hypothetical protein
MKIKYKAICKIELHDLFLQNNFAELIKFGTHKVKIDGKYYYIGDIEKGCVSFIEFEESEHEIEICEPILSHPTEKGGVE